MGVAPIEAGRIEDGSPFTSTTMMPKVREVLGNVLAVTDDPNVNLILLAALVVAVVIYFLPTMIAYARRHERRGSILLVDLFFGWTFVGWWFALIWAIVGKPETVTTFYERKEPRLFRD